MVGMLATPEFTKLRQEDSKFKSSLGYTIRYLEKGGGGERKGIKGRGGRGYGNDKDKSDR